MDGKPKLPTLIQTEPEEKLLWCRLVEAQLRFAPAFAVCFAIALVCGGFTLTRTVQSIAIAQLAHIDQGVVAKLPTK